MPIQMLVLNSVITLAFAWVLFNLGRTMLGTRSMRTEMETYLKNPQQGTWVQKFFYGWAFPWQVAIMRRMTQGSGDTIMTTWLKFSGLLFIVFAVCIVVGNIALWYLNLSA